MSIKLQLPKLADPRPRILVVGVGGAGGNAINNMIASGLDGVEFIAANTDAQALAASSAERRIQLGAVLTEGLGAGSKPDIGAAAAEEALDDIKSYLAGAHMVFLAAGMGGGTGTGAAAVIARTARELGCLTVGVVTKPFHFEGTRRMRAAEGGIIELSKYVDTLIAIPNQNLFRVASERTTFAEAFLLADQVLYSGIGCIVDLIVKEGLINLDFADVRTIMSGMGTAMMGTGEAEGERRAVRAAEEAIANPLLDDVSLKGAKGLLLSILGGPDMTLYEVDEAASRVRQEVDPDANIIVGATFEESMGPRMRVAIVASGVHQAKAVDAKAPAPTRSPSIGLVDGAVSAVAGMPTWTLPPPLPSSAHGERPSARAGVPPTVGRELWRAPGNVMIEEAAPLMAPVINRAIGPIREDAPEADYPFVPAPPQDLQRAPRRISEGDTVPYDHALATPNPGLRQATRESPPAPRRGGLLSRLMKSSPNRIEARGGDVTESSPNIGSPNSAASAVPPKQRRFIK